MYRPADYGDGSSTQQVSISGNTFTLSHVYITEGLYTVVVNISDDNAAFGSDSLQVEVLHIYPTLPDMTDPAQDLDENHVYRYGIADINLIASYGQHRRG